MVSENSNADRAPALVVVMRVKMNLASTRTAFGHKNALEGKVILQKITVRASVEDPVNFRLQVKASFDNLIEREQRKSQLLEGEGHSSRRDPLTQQLHQQFGTRQESLGSQAWHGNSFKYDNPFFIPTTEDGTICTHEEPMILRFLKGNIDTSSFRKTPCFRAAIGIVTAALLLFLTYTSQTLVRNGENYSLGENPWYKSRATVSAVKAAVSHMNALKQPVPPPPPTPPPETPELGSMHKVERLRELRTRFEHDIKTFEDGETYDALTRSRPTKGNPQRLTHFFAKLAQGQLLSHAKPPLAQRIAVNLFLETAPSTSSVRFHGRPALNSFTWSYADPIRDAGKRAVIACIGSPNSTAGAYSGTVNAPRSPTYGSLLLDWIARTFPSSNDMDGHIYLNLGTPPKSPLKGTMFWLHCASEFFARRGEDLSGLGMKDVDLWLVELAVEDILLMQEMHLRSKWHYIETFAHELLFKSLLYTIQKKYNSRMPNFRGDEDHDSPLETLWAAKGWNLQQDGLW
eukprot:gene18188-21667_t